MGSEIKVLIMAEHLLKCKGGHCVVSGLSPHNDMGSVYCPQVGDRLSLLLEYETDGTGSFQGHYEELAD